MGVRVPTRAGTRIRITAECAWSERRYLARSVSGTFASGKTLAIVGDRERVKRVYRVDRLWNAGYTYWADCTPPRYRLEGLVLHRNAPLTDQKGKEGVGESGSETIIHIEHPPSPPGIPTAR